MIRKIVLKYRNIYLKCMQCFRFEIYPNNYKMIYGPEHDKINDMRPAKTQISLGIRRLVAKDPNILQTDSELLSDWADA